MWKNVNQCLNLNPRPSEHKSPLISTRPGLPPTNLTIFYCNIWSHCHPKFDRKEFVRFQFAAKPAWPWKISSWSWFCFSIHCRRATLLLGKWQIKVRDSQWPWDVSSIDTTTKIWPKCFLFFKGANSCLFYCLFLFFQTTILQKYCRLQQDSNSRRQGRRQERWPFDHHHGPRVHLLFAGVAYLRNSRVDRD